MFRATRSTDEVVSARGKLPAHDDADAVAMLATPPKPGSANPGWKPADRFETEGVNRNSGRNTQLRDGSVVMDRTSRSGPVAAATPADGMSFVPVAHGVPALKQAAHAPASSRPAEAQERESSGVKGKAAALRVGESISRRSKSEASSAPSLYDAKGRSLAAVEGLQQSEWQQPGKPGEQNQAGQAGKSQQQAQSRLDFLKRVEKLQEDEAA